MLIPGIRVNAHDELMHPSMHQLIMRAQLSGERITHDGLLTLRIARVLILELHEQLDVQGRSVRSLWTFDYYALTISYWLPQWCCISVESYGTGYSATVLPVTGLVRTYQ